MTLARTNTELNQGSGGDKLAALDDTGRGEHIPLSALVDPDGALIGATNPLPVTGTATVSGAVEISNLPATQAVSAASLPLPDDAATEATVAAILARQADGTAHVVVDNFPGPDEAGLTNAELRAAPVPVSGPATDAELRATPLPVSGTVTATGPLTDAQLRATDVPVSAAALPLPAGAATEATLGSAKTDLDTLVARTPALGQAAMAASSPVVLASDQAAIPVTVSGVATAALQGTGNTSLGSIDTKLSSQATAANQATGITSLASIDTKLSSQATAANQSTANTSLSSIDGKLATAITADYDSGAGTQTMQMHGIALPASGGAVAGGTSTNPVRTDPTGTTTQPVSGTVTANIGTSGSLALDATLTGGTAKAIARGGAKGATTAADLTSTAEGTDHQALDVQIYHGGTAKDPTAIRALTSSDAVTAVQGTAAGLSGYWPVRCTDGTNAMPAMDAVGRAGFVKVTDGTNTMPTADAAARKAFVALTDGTNTGTVKAASTAAVATDTSIVVSLHPSSPVQEQKASTASISRTATSTISANIQASNANRLGLIVFNDSSSYMFLKYGSTASSTSFTYKINPGANWEMPKPIYTGAVDVILDAGSGNAQTTETTA